MAYLFGMYIPNPLIIDGGLSNEMESLGCDLNHPLWTAKYISENPEKIIQTHLNYLNAGAGCISTFGYQASIDGLKNQGHSHQAAINIINQSVELAVEARNLYYKTQPNQKVLIAASVGPYGAYLADGSEYRGNYGISPSTLRAFHEERLKIYDQSEADLIAIETIPDLTEVKVLNELTKNITKKCWISFQCKNDQEIADGTSIQHCAGILEDNNNIFAIGANCISIDWVDGIIERLKSESTKRIIIYPNGGGYFDADQKVWHNPDTPLSLHSEALRWLEMGASIIGGCCKIGSSEIASLVELINPR